MDPRKQKYLSNLVQDLRIDDAVKQGLQMNLEAFDKFVVSPILSKKKYVGQEGAEARYEKIKEVPIIGDVAKFAKEDLGPLVEETLLNKIARPLLDPAWDRAASLLPESWGGLLRGEGVRTGSGDPRFLDFWTPEGEKPGLATLQKFATDLSGTVTSPLTRGPLAEGIQQFVGETIERKPKPFGVDREGPFDKFLDPARAKIGKAITEFGEPSGREEVISRLESNRSMRDKLKDIKIPMPDISPSTGMIPKAQIPDIPVGEMVAESIRPAPTKFESDVIKLEEIEESKKRALAMTPTGQLKPDAKTDLSARELRETKTKDLTKLAPGIRAISEAALFLPVEMAIPLASQLRYGKAKFNPRTGDLITESQIGGLAGIIGTKGGGPIGTINRTVAKVADEILKPVQGAEEIMGATFKLPISAYDKVIDTTIAKRMQNLNTKSVNEFANAANELMISEKWNPAVTLNAINAWMRTVPQVTPELISSLKLSKRSDNITDLFMLDDSGTRIIPTEGIQYPSTQQVIDYQLSREGLSPTDARKLVEEPKSATEAMVGRDLSKTDTPADELFIPAKLKKELKDKLPEPEYPFKPKINTEADPRVLTKQQIIDTVQEAFMNDPGRLNSIRGFLNKNYASRVSIPGTKGQWRKENVAVNIFDEEVKRLGIPIRGGQVKYDPNIPLKIQETPDSIPVNEAGDSRYLVDDQAIPGSKEDMDRVSASENPEFIAQLNKAKTYDDKLLAVARENIRRRHPGTDWYEMDPREKSTWEKYDASPSTHLDKDTIAALDNMEKEEVLRLSKNHFKEIQGQKMVKDPYSPKSNDTEVDQLELSPLEAQPENVSQMRSKTRVGRMRNGVEDSRAMPMKHADDAGGIDEIYKKIDEMVGKDAGFDGTRLLVSTLNQIHDSTTQLRILQESYYKSKGINAFKLGGSEDLLAMVTLAPQAPVRGYKRGRGYYDTFIEPLIDEDVTLDVMNEYLAYSHFLDLENAGMKGNIPVNLIMDRATGRSIKVGDYKNKLKKIEEKLKKIEIDPTSHRNISENLKVIERSGDVFVTTDRDIKTAWDKLELSKMYMQKEYSRVIEELIANRIITIELGSLLRDKYSNFNPSTYLLAEESTIASGAVLDTVNFGEALGRYKSLPDRLKTNDNIANADIVGAAAPLDAHIMYMMRHEVFMQKQKVNKAFVAMMKHHDNIQDVTEEFLKPIIKKQEKGVERVVTKYRNLYDASKDTGFVSYYEDSKPKIFGVKTVNPDGSVRIEPIDKSWYKIINGRGGLQSRSPSELLSMVATTNSYFKSIYTTYDPIFMIGNSMIDSLVVALKYRVMPWTVYGRLLKSVVKGINSHDYIKQGKMLDVIETKGGVAGRFEEANISREVKQIISDPNQGGGTLQVENALVLDPGQRNMLRSELDILSAELLNPGLVFQSTARTLRRGFAATTGKVTKRLRIWNEAVEQAPRMAVTEKLLKRTMGRKEFNRVFGKTLSDDEYNKQLWEEWTPHFDKNNKPITPQGKGYSLIDSPEIGQAAMVALESTINFYRGGEQVRYLNNYIMFLNASMEGFKLPFRALGFDFAPNMRPVVGAKPGAKQIEIGTYERTPNSLYTDKDLMEGGLKGALEKGAFTKNNSPFTLKPGKGRQKITNQYDAPLGQYKIPDAIKSLPLIGKHLPDETDPKVANAFMAAMMTSTYAPIMLYNMQFAEYWDIPAHIRYNSLIIMRPSLKDENGEPIKDPLTKKVVPRYITMPHKTRELSIFFGGLAYMMETMFSDNPTDFSLWIHTVSGASIPLTDRPGRDRNWFSWNTITPEVISVASEVYRGWDDYRDQPIVDDTVAHRPYKEQYTDRTSSAYRVIAQRLPDVPGLEGLLQSPQRLEHLGSSITGGVGRTVQRPLDLIVETVEELKRDKTLPLQIMAEKWIKGSYTDQDEIEADLSTKELNELMIEVDKKRSPEGLAEKFIETTGLDRFIKEGGGGLKEIAYEETIEKIEEETGGKVVISRKETREVGKKLSAWGDEKLKEQKILDSRLQLWMKNPNDPNGLPPEEYNSEVARLNSGYYERVGQDGKKIIIQKPVFAEYPNAIQSQLDPKVKELWYNNIYTAAGALEDDRDKAQILLSAYFGIKSPFNDPSKTWVQYYDERDEFMKRLVDTFGEQVLGEFHRLRVKRYTPTQKAADNANRYLAKFFDLGSDIDDLYPDWKQYEPNAREYWEQFLDSNKKNKQYLKKTITTNDPVRDAEHNYRARIINKIYNEREFRRQQLVEEDAKNTIGKYQIPLMDAMLVFWRSRQGFTPAGKDYFIKLNQGKVKNIPVHDMD